jgi:hypothetical protein
MSTLTVTHPSAIAPPHTAIARQRDGAEGFGGIPDGLLDAGAAAGTTASPLR